MIPWSATMSSALTLYCVFGTWLVISTGAITVSIDRSDLKAAPTQSSMIANGWRPLASSYEDTIGTNVSPSSNLERNAPLHPVLGKYQEHMSTSEKQKPPRKAKPTSHHDYTPPSILGSFTVLGHAAAKSRPEAAQSSSNKYLNSETQEYTFLIPPPKNAYRFDVDQQRKAVFRENAAYPRQPQYVPQQVHHDPHRAAAYFIKGYVDSANTANNHNHPPAQSSSKNRPFVTSYAIPQQLFQPPRHEATPFESLKLNGAKPYLQPPGSNAAIDFTKSKQNEQDQRQSYQTFKPPPPPPQPHHNPHAISPSGTGNYYSQVNHRYKPSYERNPAFLVHESHEISYVTPPDVYSGYNIGPSTPYESLLPPEVYSSPATAAITSSTAAATSTTTNAPRFQEPGKFVQSNELLHEFKQNRPGNGAVKQADSVLHTGVFPGGGVPGTYYVSEHQDLTPPPAAWPTLPNKYTSDINEVLPRVNPPTKFSSADAVRPPPLEQQQQQQRYQSSAAPPTAAAAAAVQQQTSQPEYETPESISLKHFNEQQFLLQQQLLQRDRQRLAEQERQQQLEIEKHQREELQRRQQELKKLLEKEEAEGKLREEALKLKSQPLVQVLPDKVMDGQMPYTIQLAQFEIPKITIPTESTIRLSSPSTYGEQALSQHTQTIQPIGELPTSFENINQQQQLQQQIEYEEPQAEVRPYRPQKPSRDQYRRRKPTTINYDAPPATDVPTQLPETLSPVTPFSEEVSSVYTTPTPETLTVTPVTVPTQRPRVRRPGVPGRRRRPTTTTTEESITVQTFDEDFLKYERPEQQQQYTPDNRRRRVKPTAASNNPETVTEKRANIRKRPGHRVRINPGEPFDAEIVTEVVNHNPVNSHRETLNNYEGHVELTSQPIDKFADYTSVQSPAEERAEDANETSQYKYQQETVRNTADAYNDGHEEYRNQHENFNTDANIPLEELFGRTDGNYLERATTEPSTSTSTTSTTTTASPPPTQSTQVSVSTTRSLKIRPLRYGNNTRPRFSIKDYKTRMDYKNKIAGMSTTETSANQQQQVKQRQNGSTKLQQVQQQGEQASKESAGGRYKYVSRGNYRTSTTAATVLGEKDSQQAGVEDHSSTTERPSRFVPKRRPNGNIYRSRISNSNNNNVRPQLHTENDSSAKLSSTARPENVFSSSIRRRPIMKNKLHLNRSNYQQSSYQQPERKEYAEVPTEMTAEETSFYSPMTTSSSRAAMNEVETVTAEEKVPQETAEKASEGKEFEEQLNREDDDNTRADRNMEVNSPADDKVPTESSNNIEEASTSEASSNAADDSNSNSGRTEVPEESNEPSTPSAAEENTSHPESAGSSDREAVKFNEPISESTTKFDIRSDEEELFAKASQSVADLTSSASALYDKPGMFKAVSPESRVVSAHFKITSDEPTLPIEAFFQELAKKN